MTISPAPSAHDTLYRRIDEMPISVADREAAKAQLRAAIRFADALCGLVAALRAGAVTVARPLRAARRASPQH
jgi:hypothetical protein